MDSRCAKLNPNWEQLRERLKARKSNRPQSAIKYEREETGSLLGKRKAIPETQEDSESSGSVLTPKNSDFSLTDEIAMDCEMVGVGSEGNKSAIGRVTLVNAWGNILYDEFVRPLEHVVDFRSRISGIRPHHLKKAKDFLTVQRKVVEMLKGRILVGHALRNDLKALLLSHPKKDMRDTSEYKPFQCDGRKRALRDLSFDILGVKIQQNEHCSVEDARAAMLIYQKHKKQWEKHIKLHIKLKTKNTNRRRKRKSIGNDDSNIRHEKLEQS